MHLKRLKYTLFAMVLITSMVLTAAITTGNTLAMLIDQTLNLVNTFAPGKVSGDTNVDINIDKIVVATGVNGINAGGFTFELTDLQTNDVLATISDRDGKAKLSLSFTQEDVGKTFSYTLSELNDGRQDFTYSTKVYRIDITVAFEGNDLVAKLLLDGEPVDEIACEFVNVYQDGSGEPLPPPPAGDSAMPMLYVALAAISLASIALILKKQKKLF